MQMKDSIISISLSYLFGWDFTENLNHQIEWGKKQKPQEAV